MRREVLSAHCDNVDANAKNEEHEKPYRRRRSDSAKQPFEASRKALADIDADSQKRECDPGRAMWTGCAHCAANRCRLDRHVRPDRHGHEGSGANR
jgi:hypothetical protein